MSDQTAIEPLSIMASVNGRDITAEVEPRLLLSDFLRHQLGLRGTHVGCEQGVCGACTVIVDGAAVRSCLLLAVQVEGSQVTTVEGLGSGDGLTALQDAFHRNHGLQCGFCTPGILTTLTAYFQQVGVPEEDEIRALLSGNVCRCTGYHNIVAAVREFVRGSPTVATP
jgi:aerobic-type carbon monoxide dehydrogenase small subunit (CoxS/CutS family)